MPAAFQPSDHVVLQYFEKDCLVYNQLPHQLATCKDIILGALAHDGSLINNVMTNLLQAETLENHYDKYNHLHEYETLDELMADLEEYMLLAVRSYPKAVECVWRWSKYDQAALLAKMVRINGQAIRHVTPDQRTPRLVILAMPTFKQAKNYAVGKLRSQIDSMRDFDTHANVLARLHELYPD